MRRRPDPHNVPLIEAAGDSRVTDRDRYLDERRREALANIALWERSNKIWARDELTYWRGELERVDRELAG